MKKLAILGITIFIFLNCALIICAEENKNELPNIPGITVEDKFPKACVSCHRNYPEKQKDFRLTKILQKWETKTEEEYRIKAQAAAPEGLKIQGKHPKVGHLIKKIPGDCLMCHWSQSKTTPPFARLIHLIHLENSPDNHFMTNYGGVCTHCHKLDPKTGIWGLPNNSEE